MTDGPLLTIHDLLRDHPWPKEYAAERRLEWLWTIDVDTTPSRLWPFVADVSRVNRALGNPEMKFVERGGERWGTARYGGILHEWRELPWDWVAGRWFRHVRIYTRGSMRAYYGLHRLEALGTDRTRLYLYMGVVPRWAVLTPIMRLNFAAIGRAYRKLMPQLAARTASRPTVLEAPATPTRPEAEARLGDIAARLRAHGLDAAAVDRLIAYVRDGDELDVCRILVRERARAWTIDEDVLLRVFLHATRAGLLEIAWDVVCPHCRGVRDSEHQLAHIPREGSCEVCGVQFGTEDAVEVSFRVHPSIRHVEQRLFCSAEPATKPHIHVQRALAAGDDAAIDLELGPGRYRLRTRGQASPAGWLDVRTDPTPDPSIPWRASSPPGDVATGEHAAFVLVNDSSETRTFIVENARPSDLALRPGRLLSHQEFRDLFSNEFLGADVRLAVGQQAILFTDIVGSTAMYAERGDPYAFSVVKRHFADVFAIIASQRGAVVKTIGDATMGAFTDPVDAVRAAGAIQRAFADPAGLKLRISINTDACIAVRLNANIDYFGHAVNLAAKLQAAAGGGQVVMSPSTYEASGVAAELGADAADVETIGVPIKGLGTTVTAYRWTVDARRAAHSPPQT